MSIFLELPVHIILLMSIFLELPVPVVKGTNLSGLEPSGDAVKVEGVGAHPPGHGAFFTGGTGLICLTLNAKVHDVVPADGAVVHHNVPGPQSHSIPLLHLKSFLFLNKISIIKPVKTQPGSSYHNFSRSPYR